MYTLTPELVSLSTALFLAFGFILLGIVDHGDQRARETRRHEKMKTNHQKLAGLLVLIINQITDKDEESLARACRKGLLVAPSQQLAAV